MRVEGGRRVRRRPIPLLFVGTFLSRLGESITLVTLIWIAFERSHSTGDVALVQFAYTALIPIGGFFVGSLLDRYLVVPVMVTDAAVKAAIVALAIVAAVTGVAVVPATLLAAFYLGLAWMVGGAGLPTLHRGRGPAGRPLAGEPVRLPRLLRDCVRRSAAGGRHHRDARPPRGVGPGRGLFLTYGVLLWSVRAELMGFLPPAVLGAFGVHGLVAGYRLVFRSPLLVSLTAMFMSLNALSSVVAVAMPLYTTQVLHGGAAEYATLLAIRSAGRCPAPSSAAGPLPGSGSAGRSSWRSWAEAACSTCRCSASARCRSPSSRCSSGGVVASSQGPWVQTLRMRVIPPELRSRAFASIRSLTNVLAPPAALAAGVFVPLIGVPAIFGLIALGWMGTAGGLATVRELRESVA